MKFTYDFENIRTDKLTGDIYIGVRTDIDVDTIWAGNVIQNIAEFNDECFEFEKCNFIVNVSRILCRAVNILELRIPLNHRGYLDQKMIDLQKKMLIGVSETANSDLEDRINYKKLMQNKIDEAIKTTPEFIEKIKQLNP